MAFLQANIYSNVLEIETCVDILLPQKTHKIFGKDSKGCSSDIPVLYLLHGMGGNHSVWQRRTAIERYVADLGIAVIMPSTDLNWYTDTTYDMKYWTYISEELPQICHELFPQLTVKREKTFAAGLSMGGYGAVKLGLAKPESFAAVASLSGMLMLGYDEDGLLSVRNKQYWEGIFGPLENIKGSKNDLVYLLQKAMEEKKQLPALYICCGKEDPLLPASQGFIACLDQLKVDYQYETGEGVHDWLFWDTWIQKVLLWLPIDKK